MLKRYIVTKFVTAKNLAEALKLEGNIVPDAIQIEESPDDGCLADAVGYELEPYEDY